ncbi:hypothetical protein KM295_05310 [Natronomonas sp. F2-12]|jgi:hypothetical protein|uniref:Uncharacterized protein n=1 Tax=Natronomonas aquatica TaxID=2841590 RepID=A0A9R1D427_9EURY|nr:hypothetical protein [Natronomonas aquatica]MCQ4332924.1 hypothetical protein [Natronomonas aquatica]
MFTHDEVAGIVDLFGALTHEEAVEALSELAYRRGEDPPSEAIGEAIEAFALVEFESGDDRLLAPGPAAFPELPAGSEDLPHILDVGKRSVDRDAIERAAVERLRSEVDRVTADGDGERAAALLEVSYDIEAWNGTDLSAVRDRLEPIADGTN